MILVLLVFLGGVLTILSPCTLPVLPFVFARSEQKFLLSGLDGSPIRFAGKSINAAKCGSRCESRIGSLSAARCRHGIPVGTLRRTDSWPCAHRRGNIG